MISYINNNEALTADEDVFSTNAIGHLYNFVKPYNDDYVDNVSFVIDIQDFIKIPDDFYASHLRKNNLIFCREHKIDAHTFANGLSTKIKQFNLDCKKIYIVVAHSQQQYELEQYFIEYDIRNINIYCNMFWLLWPRIKLEKTDFQYQNNIVKKFSLFSRRYTEWRRNLYLDLLIRNILPECHYTFSNLHPDIDDPKSVAQMTENLPSYMDIHKGKITDWLSNNIISIEYQDPFDNKISYMLQESAINIAFETHIIEQSNGVTLTEKTYKPILLNRPFLVYGIPGILQMLHKEGFKTFKGILDESYDDVLDANDRRLVLVREIDRINSLSKGDLDSLLEKCQTICQYNREVAFSKNRQLPDNFKNINIFGSK